MPSGSGAVSLRVQMRTGSPYSRTFPDVYDLSFSSIVYTISGHFLYGKFRNPLARQIKKSSKPPDSSGMSGFIPSVKRIIKKRNKK